MTTLSSEELQAQRSDFGLRLSNSMAKYGPLCVGIDPHRKLLTDWGYNVDAEGAELFSMRMLQAANGRAAAVKFQTPMFERYGAKGFEALERVLYAARQMGVITIVDCLRGGLSTTISAIADIGATIGQWMQDSGVDPSKFTGPILSPGYGWQGAEAKDLKTVFRGTRGNVLVTVSRFIASHGPDIAALSQATESIALDVRQALMEATVEGSENQ